MKKLVYVTRILPDQGLGKSIIYGYMMYTGAVISLADAYKARVRSDLDEYPGDGGEES